MVAMSFGKWPDEVRARPAAQYREMLDALWDRIDMDAEAWKKPPEEVDLDA